jgi:uncharacterized membrane protein YdbT with pleckstrin-like domain
MIRHELEQMVGSNETVLWRGAPVRKAFLIRSIFNLLLPISIVWCCIDIPMIIESINDIRTGEDTMSWFTVPFLLLHMFPVWIYLASVITSFVRLKNTCYIITDKSVYISGGVFALNTQVKPLAKLSTVTINRGLVEKMTNVGTVVLNDDTTTNSNRANFFSVNSQDLLYLTDYDNVFKLIRDTQDNAYSLANAGSR